MKYLFVFIFLLLRYLNENKRAEQSERAALSIIVEFYTNVYFNHTFHSYIFIFIFSIYIYIYNYTIYICSFEIKAQKNIVYSFHFESSRVESNRDEMR